MKTIDKHCLYQIKQKFGGSVKLRSGINWLRLRIHHKKGLLDLINAVNGEIRNPIRLLQFNKLCEFYNIPLIQPNPLTLNNGWFSGFFDSKATVELFKDSKTSMSLEIKHANKYLLNPLIELYGGEITIFKQEFIWTADKTSDINQLLEYFRLCPSRSSKHVSLKYNKKFTELKSLKAHKAGPNSILGKTWIKYQNKFNSRSYSTCSNNQYIAKELNPWYVSGFTDAEGCFSLSISNKNSSSAGFYIRPSFVIHLAERDRFLLERLRLFFGVGYISKGDNNSFYYGVSSLKDLNEIIIPHFLNYPLVTQKQLDFKLFKLAIELINLKKHLSTNGIIELVGIKASINKGLSARLKSEFPNIKPFPRPLFETVRNLNLY